MPYPVGHIPICQTRRPKVLKASVQSECAHSALVQLHDNRLGCYSDDPPVVPTPMVFCARAGMPYHKETD